MRKLLYIYNNFLLFFNVVISKAINNLLNDNMSIFNFIFQIFSGLFQSTKI